MQGAFASSVPSLEEESGYGDEQMACLGQTCPTIDRSYSCTKIAAGREQTRRPHRVTVLWL